MLAAEEGPSEQPASSRENIWPLATQPHQVTAFRRYLYGPVIAGIPLAMAGPCGSRGGINSENACSSSNAGMPAQAPTHKATNRCHPIVSIIDGIKARDFKDVRAGVAVALSTNTPIPLKAQVMIAKWLAENAPSEQPPTGLKPPAAYTGVPTHESIAAVKGSAGYASRPDVQVPRPTFPLEAPPPC